jgi:hypothetical protein
VSNGNSSSSYLSGETHVYDVSWDGPYAAVDLESDLNDSNRLHARIEVGFPGYKSTGDQPYRIDWEHPKSVEDSKSMFGALHLGLLANWTTALTPAIGLSVGLSYDYYSVANADVKTNLSEDYYGPSYIGSTQEIYDYGITNNYWTNDNEMYKNAAGYVLGGVNLADALNAAGLYEICGNSWSCTEKKEVNSFYRSIGIRVGLSGKF